MPHLSPIIWIVLYALVWLSFLLVFVLFEYYGFSLSR